jgi:UDP-N-acetylmuramate: L-alanyl-gamma-D-glutamyl-meso-diaminopimelate ligase
MGICGSAMGALAMMLRERGYAVRGSDASPYPPMSTRLEAAGVEILRGYEASNLDWGPDAVVIGNVMRPDYPEVLRLRELSLPASSMAEALADVFLGPHRPTVVTGTHGKTTTSSMTAWILERAGLSPGFFIGGVVAPWGSSHRLAPSPASPFVVEGDEYDTAFFDKDSKFHHYRPHFASINNIEFDHADIFPDLDAILDTFARFARRVPAHGVIVTSLGDPGANAALTRLGRPEATILATAVEGVDRDASKAAVRAASISPAPSGSSFLLHLPSSVPVPVHLPASGLHNVRNALVAAALAHAQGADPSAVAAALDTFTLPLRRLTLRAEAAGIPILDDFAHHPTAIAATLAALRERYPGRRVLALFEVQSNTARRRVFQDAFADALATADRVFFSRPLSKSSDPLPPEARLDLPALADAISARGTPATIVEEIDALADAVAAEARPGADVIVAMSGRHFDGIHMRIASRLR